ncbi:MAG: hypothetical protein AAGC46_11205 [Solirubrobacteraceae bacterium]
MTTASKVAVALGLLAAAVCPGAALAQTPATGAPSLSVPADGTAFVEADAAGDTTAVWVERAGGRVSIRSASERAGGGWGAVETIVSARAATKATSTEPVPTALAVGHDGTAQMLWGRVERGNGSPHTLQVATRSTAGRWTEQRIAAAKGKRLVGPTAALAVTADGTALVLWSAATAVQSDLSVEKARAGVAYVTERSPAGAWAAPRRLGIADGYSAAPQLSVNRAGAAAAIWAQPSRTDEDAPLSYATRAATGGWTAGSRAYALKGPTYGGQGPALLDETGRLHLLFETFGNYGVSGFAHQLVGGGAAPAKPALVPEPTKDQTLQGFLGSGYVHASGAVLAPDGTLVVVTGHEPPDVENGAFGTGAIWAASRTPAGQWSVVPVDGLAATSGAMDVDVSTDAAGAVVATWTASTGLPPTCGSVVYRSVRGADGTWSPRQAVAAAGPGGTPRGGDIPVNSGPCFPVEAHRTSGTDPVAWWHSGGTLTVTRTADTLAADPSSPVPAVEQLTTTWQQVRRAGGLQLRCSAAFAGWCSASTVGAAEAAAAAAASAPATDPTAGRTTNFPARALGCFALRATDAIGAPGTDQVVTLPVATGCMHGWVPPTVGFDVVVATDAPGHQPAATHLAVTITR